MNEEKDYKLRRMPGFFDSPPRPDRNWRVRTREEENKLNYREALGATCPHCNEEITIQPPNGWTARDPLPRRVQCRNCKNPKYETPPIVRPPGEAAALLEKGERK